MYVVSHAKVVEVRSIKRKNKIHIITFFPLTTLVLSTFFYYRCWSYVGKKGGQQILSLQPPDSRSRRCFVSVGKPIHEMLHALGIFHEQARPDRDNYIDIIEENIVPRECCLSLVHSFSGFGFTLIGLVTD